MGYSLQAPWTWTSEGDREPGRNSQFELINRTVKRFLADEQPVISVDTKERGLVRDCKSDGRQLRPRGQPDTARAQDFLIRELGRDTPYGVDDLEQNTGRTIAGMDHDTAAFAVDSIRHWWQSVGQWVYPHAHRLLITAGAGGSNAPRVWLWKAELQELADETGLSIAVCHFPPGASKWNRIEHRLFSFVNQQWRRKPLIGYQVIANLIATPGARGPKVNAEVDESTYNAGTDTDDQELLWVLPSSIPQPPLGRNHCLP